MALQLAIQLAGGHAPGPASGGGRTGGHAPQGGCGLARPRPRLWWFHTPHPLPSMEQAMSTPPIANGDGTYNGAAMLAQLTGLPYEEVAWTAKRLQQLMRDAGLPKAQAIAQVKAEAASKPWLKG